MAINRNVDDPSIAHTINEFISAGQNGDNDYKYRDMSFIEIRDSKEFVVNNVIDTYLYELKEISVEVTLTNKEKDRYRYNPKLLAYKLYGDTNLYYIILRINNLCNTHDFTIKSGKLLLIPPKAMKKALSKIERNNSNMILRYNNVHKMDVSKVKVNKYR